MKRELNQEQGFILMKVITGMEDIVKRVNQGRLSHSEIQEICLKINDEYHINGILPNWEPNQYGKCLEEILDIVNHPRVA